MSMGLVLVLTLQSKKLQHFRLTSDSVRAKQRTYPCRFALVNDGQKLGWALHVNECLTTNLQSVVASSDLQWQPEGTSF